MYNSLRTGVTSDSPSVVAALETLPFPHPIGQVTICGHSLGGALTSLLVLDLAANSGIKDPAAYTYASPRTGDPLFVSTYNQVVANSFRIANRMDIVPKLPLPPLYDHVNTLFELNPVRLLPFPPKILVRLTIPCLHALDSYLYLLSSSAGGPVIPTPFTCAP